MSLKNKVKREKYFRLKKRDKSQQKLKKRLAQSKLEENDPELKQKRLAKNIPRTLENTREPDPSTQISLSPNLVTSEAPLEDTASTASGSNCISEAESDPLAALFPSNSDPSFQPKILITTSPKATRATYDFCDELVGLLPGAEFFQRKKMVGCEMGRIAGWAIERDYRHLCVVNEDKKKPNAITLIHLPDGPTAVFKLTSIELTRQIFGHARATPHNPELVLNNFATSLGQTVGRLFQTLFPPIPEFQGRQVVTVHNQRDFLFFRRHRYAFRSAEKVALQEIGPRFTLKLRSLTKGTPAAKKRIPKPEAPKFEGESPAHEPEGPVNEMMPTQQEFIWKWKPKLETSRRVFFL